MGGVVQVISSKERSKQLRKYSSQALIEELQDRAHGQFESEVIAIKALLRDDQVLVGELRLVRSLQAILQRHSVPEVLTILKQHYPNQIA